MKENKFDYIVLGASTGLTTLNTKVIDSVLSVKGLNLAMDDTSLPSHYLMLQHFIAEGKTTKYCILAPNNLNFDTEDNQLSDNDYRFLMYVNRPYVSEYYSMFDTKQSQILAWSKWIPTIGVSYYNAEVFYPSLVTINQPNKRNRFDANGNYAYPFIKFKDSVLIDEEYKSIKFNNNYLQKINELCRRHNIQLICYLSPLMDMEILVGKSNFEVINHSNLLNNARYFNDVIHVNYLGNQLSSEQFANDFRKWIAK
uniref:hypothetical protein n=1 Tax=Gelidibacter sp. TaxID=2018083 RepID=UPI00404A493E